jgi:hypothetical protein
MEMLLNMVTEEYLCLAGKPTQSQDKYMDIQEIAEKMIAISGPLVIFSVFGMWSYLVRKGIWDTWEHFFMWPRIVVDYREHTKERSGRTGILFYVFSTSLVVTVISVVVSLILT